MDEIQQIIAEAAETTPDAGPEGDEMSDPEYVTAYLLNIIIPLMKYNNLRIEEQLRAVGIAVPDLPQMLAMQQEMAERQRAAGETAAQEAATESEGEAQQ